MENDDLSKVRAWAQLARSVGRVTISVSHLWFRWEGTCSQSLVEKLVYTGYDTVPKNYTCKLHCNVTVLKACPQCFLSPYLDIKKYVCVQSLQGAVELRLGKVWKGFVSSKTKIYKTQVNIIVCISICKINIKPFMPIITSAVLKFKNIRIDCSKYVQQFQNWRRFCCCMMTNCLIKSAALWQV